MATAMKKNKGKGHLKGHEQRAHHSLPTGLAVSHIAKNVLLILRARNARNPRAYFLLLTLRVFLGKICRAGGVVAVFALSTFA